MSNISNGVLSKGRSQTYLGKMTAYRRGNRTVMRGTTPTTINNPQSVLQMYQRLKFPNLNNVYRALRPFIRQGWETMPEGQTLHNCFITANLHFAPFGITHQQHLNGYTILDAYQVTNGTLPSIVVDTFTRGINQGISDILVGDIVPSAETTLGELSTAIVEANAGRFAFGDEIAFLSAVQVVNDGMVRVRTARTAIVLTADSDQSLGALNLLGFGAHNGRLALSAVHPDGGYCWVHTRRNNEGKLFLSSQSLQVVGQGFRTRFRQPKYLREAAESLGATINDKAFLDGGIAVSEKHSRILRAFGIPVKDSKNERSSQGTQPTISYLEYNGMVLFPNEPAPVIRTDAAPAIAVTLLDAELLGSTDALQVEANGIACTAPTLVGTVVTATLPDAVDGNPLTSLRISTATSQVLATFTAD